MHLTVYVRMVLRDHIKETASAFRQSDSVFDSFIRTVKEYILLYRESVAVAGGLSDRSGNLSDRLSRIKPLINALISNTSVCHTAWHTSIMPQRGDRTWV